ncbi:unnamed protein product [Macrosiphum euphorbiae]|uniref:Uncharacterized protein n=1 Tax=Macrosiphum euphorbiae TaxID=13131 RepID=A0AAV0WXE2_9HEMI|nr:unnamed protein product [Macrosiphum euphorbiae]
MEGVIVKSIFNIHQQNKKNIYIGYLVDQPLSVIILFMCNVTKRYLILNVFQWNKFISDDSFNIIVRSLSTVQHSKRLHLDNNFYYKICPKSESVNLYHNNNRITLSSDNLNRLKLLETMYNANIIELTNKLVMYQTVFNNACIIIKYDILYLSPDCIRSDFISTYIKDYNFKMDDLKDEEISFLLDLQQIHHGKFADIVLKPDIINQ